MSSTLDTPHDQAYFQAIEETFIRLRGAPLLLSPADWQQAEKWRQSGIPLDLVLLTLEEVFAARKERGARGRIQSLRYCAPAVESAWERMSEMTATGARLSRPSIDVGTRLACLADAVRSHPAVPDSVRQQILGLEGSAEAVEQSLIEIDRQLLSEASSRLARQERAAIEEALAKSVEPLRSRLSDEEVTRVQERLWREAVRRHLDLPVLSLFSLEEGQP